MRIAVIQFPGSNCERETLLALKRAGMQPQAFLWNHSLADLAHYAGYVLVGGFSYEDRSRAGVIAARDPLMQIIREESQKGKPVLGICNGAQILVEAGLVPGLAEYQLGAALTDNKRMSQGKILGTGYYNAWVHMRLSDHYQAGAFTRYLTPKNILRLPVAHGEGRFILPPALLTEVQAQGLNLFQYCSPSGEITREFPINPNGSMDNIAALTNKAGNVLAMMPHPERTSSCDPLFQSMRDYIAQDLYQPASPLSYSPPALSIKNYAAGEKARELIVELIITDNQALSVNNELKRAQLPLELKRQIHWEVECDSDLTYEKIIKSEVLYNKRKEVAVNPSLKPAQATAFLVRPKEDCLGQQKKQFLENHFGIKGLQSLRHSILWRVQAKEDLNLFSNPSVNLHLLFNPYAYDCYYY